MNELRWILLIAGALLIAAVYLWGLRSRARRTGPDDAARRPAVFTGGATGFEASVTPPAVPEDTFDAPAITRDPRRLEPSVSLDPDALDVERPAIERRAALDVEEHHPTAQPPTARREPTYNRRPEPQPSPRPDHYAAPASGRQEPTYGARPAEPAVAAAPEPGPPSPPAAPTEDPGSPAAPDAGQAKPKRPQKIFAVRVTAPGTARFTGQRIQEALEVEGLRFGRYDIFHSLHTDGRPIFSVASLRDPGTFDLQTMAETPYPGILVFAVLPGPVGAGEAFDEMLFTARALATHLDGALADEKGVPLTAQRAGRLREDALEFERALHAA